jgi:nucleoside-diphosphate-sugar epimerase
MQTIVVTGGSGKLGRACVRDLLEHGYAVINADLTAPKEPLCPFVQVDLENLAQTVEVFSGRDWEHRRGIDAVVHLAAIPAPGLQPNETAFRVNTMSTYNVFEATRRLRIDNVVWASSETVLGLPFDIPPPYAPIDEQCDARPETAYSLSKLLGETMAEQFCRWDPSRKIFGLRFSNVMEPDDYKQFPSFEQAAASRKFNLWGYIDARDGAQAIRKALQSDIKGSDVFTIANEDTVMSRSNEELMSAFFPDVILKAGTSANATLLSIEKAKRVLGYEPQFSWRG